MFRETRDIESHVRRNFKNYFSRGGMARRMVKRIYMKSGMPWRAANTMLAHRFSFVLRREESKYGERHLMFLMWLCFYIPYSLNWDVGRSMGQRHDSKAPQHVGPVGCVPQSTKNRHTCDWCFTKLFKHGRRVWRMFVIDLAVADDGVRSLGCHYFWTYRNVEPSCLTSRTLCFV